MFSRGIHEKATPGCNGLMTVSFANITKIHTICQNISGVCILLILKGKLSTMI